MAHRRRQHAHFIKACAQCHRRQHRSAQIRQTLHLLGRAALPRAGFEQSLQALKRLLEIAAHKSIHHFHPIGAVGISTVHPGQIVAETRCQQPHRIAQLRHRIALCCGIEIQQTKRALVMALQHLAHKRIFIGKQMVKHARAQARFCGQHAHRKLAVAVLRIKLETGGNKLGTCVRHGVRPSEKYWTGVQYTEVWFE